MSSTGIGSRLLAAASAQVLRVVGALAICLSVGITAMSLTSEHGLSVGSDSGSRTTAYATDAGLVTALVEFAAAHPAYPVAMLLGLVLVVAGDEAPLLGG